MFDQKVLDLIQVPIHSSIRIGGDRVIYIDPFKIEGEPHDADLLLLTHEHFDHFSPEDMAKVMKDDTVVVYPRPMYDDLAWLEDDCLFPVEPGQSYEVLGIPLETVAAYNLVKPFHPKSKGWVGYVLTLGVTRVYIAGDTDQTPENSQVSCDIALVPIGGTYTMNAKKAAAFVNTLRPHTVIPVHYGTVVGKPQDADTFKAALDPDIRVKILLSGYPFNTPR